MEEGSLHFFKKYKAETIIISISASLIVVVAAIAIAYPFISAIIGIIDEILVSVTLPLVILPMLTGIITLAVNNIFAKRQMAQERELAAESMRVTQEIAAAEIDNARKIAEDAVQSNEELAKEAIKNEKAIAAATIESNEKTSNHAIIATLAATVLSTFPLSSVALATTIIALSFHAPERLRTLKDLASRATSAQWHSTQSAAAEEAEGESNNAPAAETTTLLASPVREGETETTGARVTVSKIKAAAALGGLTFVSLACYCTSSWAHFLSPNSDLLDSEVESNALAQTMCYSNI